MKIVAITSCSTGIAHTFMAAENLELKAKELGYEIKVETQGANGPENVLTSQEIKEADVVIFAIERKVDESRFDGKYVLEVTPGKAIKTPEEVINQAINKNGVRLVKSDGDSDDLFGSLNASGAFKHVLSGISYMLPLVVAGGIILALSFACGLYAYEEVGSLGWVLFQIGCVDGLGMMVPILSAFISHSIANKAGFASGLVGGMIAVTVGAGFIGGIISGLMAGYLVLFLLKNIKLPKSLEGLKAIVIIPLLSVLIVGLLMYYVVGTPIGWLTTNLNNFLTSLSGGSVIILGIIYGLFYVDLGGPFSKIISAFSIGAMASGINGPMAAQMVCGMVPPLGLALATLVKPSYWSKSEKESGKAGFILGLSFITEGAIPFAAANPFAILPACVAGSMVSAISAFLMGLTVAAPHGGIFLLLIPNAINNIPGFLIALALGTVTTCVVALGLKTYQLKKQ